MNKTIRDDVAALWTDLEQGQAGEVLDALAERPVETTPVYQTLHGLALYETGRYAEAAETFRRILEKEPENAVAQLFIVLALFRIGENRLAGQRLLHETIIFPHRFWLIDGESLSEMQGFIESDFIEKLREFKLEGIPVPIFKRVEMLGTPEILYRHPINGSRVNNPDPGGVKHQLPGGIIIRMQYERYLRFAALAALKTDKEMLEDIEKWQEERKKAGSAPGTPGAGTQ